MFEGCTSLKIASVKHIAQNINNISETKWDSGMQSDYGVKDYDFGKITFSVTPDGDAEAAVYNEACMIFGQKGWTVENTAS